MNHDPKHNACPYREDQHLVSGITCSRRPTQQLALVTGGLRNNQQLHYRAEFLNSLSANMLEQLESDQLEMIIIT